MAAEAIRTESAKIQELEERYEALQAPLRRAGARDDGLAWPKKPAEKRSAASRKPSANCASSSKPQCFRKRRAKRRRRLRMEPGARVRLKDVREPATVLRLSG